MPEVIMPKMGDAMEEGTLLKWLKSEGDDVSEGDAIAEIETDKVTLELEAEDSGTLAQLIASEGDEVPVGGAIAFIAGEGEEVPERRRGGSLRRGGSRSGRGRGGRRPGDRHRDRGQGVRRTAARRREAPSGNGAGGNGQFRASPIVRRLARENDLDLSKIDGSGPPAASSSAT
jgi:pyruvate dehydrogenase E2 component (dihydrolipoamide acetyltransferase)